MFILTFLYVRFLLQPLAWVNTPVFDYKGYLKSGSKTTLYCWGILEENLGDVEMPNALGIASNNPNQDTALAITLSFPKYRDTSNILFPLKETILNTVRMQPPEEEPTASANVREEMLEISNRDPLCDLYELERKQIWSLRRYCMKNVPLILPKLLQCVDWNNHLEV